jgi:hypothetical protein
MRSVVYRNVVMRRIPVLLYTAWFLNVSGLFLKEFALELRLEAYRYKI